jgi:hypothetical protein
MLATAKRLPPTALRVMRRIETAVEALDLSEGPTLCLAGWYGCFPALSSQASTVIRDVCLLMLVNAFAARPTMATGEPKDSNAKEYRNLLRWDRERIRSQPYACR